MPSQIQITSFTGALPAQVFVADIYGNNSTLVGTISAAIPPAVIFTLPSLFDFAPAVMVTIIDSNGCNEFSIEDCISFFPSATPTPTPTITPSNTPTNTPTPSQTSTNAPTPSQTPTNTVTPTQSLTQTPTNTSTPTQTPTQTTTNSSTPTPTPTPTQSSDPYPYFLAGYCYDGRMYAEGGSYSSNCTQVQSGLGSATRYKSNYPYSYLYSGLWSTVNMFIYDTVTASLLNSKPIADGCQYWETSSLGKVIAGYPQVGFDCTTPGGCCPGTPPI